MRDGFTATDPDGFQKFCGSPVPNHNVALRVTRTDIMPIGRERKANAVSGGLMALKRLVWVPFVLGLHPVCIDGIVHALRAEIMVLWMNIDIGH